jgi:sulfite reductase alpha subunit-like flavoprotein
MQQEAGAGLKLLVCYGSQTGNAEFLAKRLHALVDKELPHLHPQLQCMKDYTKVSLSCLQCMVIMTNCVTTSTQNRDNLNAPAI